MSVGIFQRNRFHSDDENHEDFAGGHFNYGKFETICRRAGSTNQSRKLHFLRNLLHPKISNYIFHIVLYTILTLQTKKVAEQSVSDYFL